MKKTTLFLFLLVSVFILHCSTSKTKDKEWLSLFNGKNLDGWVVKAPPEDVAKNFWKVEDGVIRANSHGDSLHDYIWLMTEKEYTDFELKLEFRAYKNSTGNSGVQIRSRYSSDEYWLNGPQIDINPRGAWRTGMVWDETRGNQRWIFPDLDSGWVNPKMAINTPVMRYAEESDKWNEMRIMAKGMNIKAWLNNTLVTDFNGQGILNDENHKKHQVGEKGHIALQIHTKDQLKIDFREISLCNLKD